MTEVHAEGDENPFGALDERGWLVGARVMRSPNQDARPDGIVDLVVIHSISLPPGEFGGPWVDALFCNRLDADAHPYFRAIVASPVSAHFFIRRDGVTTQYVSTGHRAWHAGRSCWRGRERCNDFSIGIELEGCDTRPFADVQYRILIHLLDRLCSRYPISGITGHAHVAPDRKTDPGPCFDWARLGPELAPLIDLV